MNTILFVTWQCSVRINGWCARMRLRENYKSNVDNIQWNLFSGFPQALPMWNDWGNVVIVSHFLDRNTQKVYGRLNCRLLAFVACRPGWQREWFQLRMLVLEYNGLQEDEAWPCHQIFPLSWWLRWDTGKISSMSLWHSSQRRDHWRE